MEIMLEHSREKGHLKELLLTPDLDHNPPLVTACRLSSEEDDPSDKWSPIELTKLLVSVAREGGFGEELVNCADRNNLSALHWSCVNNFVGMAW